MEIKHLYPNSNQENVSRGSGIYSYNLLTETNNTDIVYLLLKSLISKVQETSSPRLESMTVLWVCDLLSCNLLVETNNYGLGVIVLSALVSELQNSFSLGHEPVLRFIVKEAIFTTISTQVSFSLLWPLCLQSPRQKKITLF
jgi:hypothetical protein